MYVQARVFLPGSDPHNVGNRRKVHLDFKHMGRSAMVSSAGDGAGAWHSMRSYLPIHFLAQSLMSVSDPMTI